MSIIKHLEAWVDANRSRLQRSGIVIDARISTPTSDMPRVASVELEGDSVIISYAVWERTDCRTELVVFNKEAKEIVLVKDTQPESPSVVDSDLDDAVAKILSGEYAALPPLPVKLPRAPH
jgi:hypothetical protein